MKFMRGRLADRRLGAEELGGVWRRDVTAIPLPYTEPEKSLLSDAGRARGHPFRPLLGSTPKGDQAPEEPGLVGSVLGAWSLAVPPAQDDAAGTARRFGITDAVSARTVGIQSSRQVGRIAISGIPRV